MITFLHGLQVFLVIVGILAVIAVLILGADLAYYEYRTHQGVKKSIAKTRKTARNPQREEQLRETAKFRLRRKKEEEAWRGFFETTYIRGFENNGMLRNNGVRVPSRKAYRYFATMEALAQQVARDIQREADSAIFDITREL